MEKCIPTNITVPCQDELHKEWCLLDNEENIDGQVKYTSRQVDKLHKQWCLLDGDENIDFMIPVLMNILSVTENKNPADCLGVTPLHQIARVLKPWELENRIFTEKHREVMSLLLQNVEDKHPKDEDGKTPADYLLRSFESCWFGAISAARYGDECKTLFELAQKYGYGEIWKILKCPLP